MLSAARWESDSGPKRAGRKFPYRYFRGTEQCFTRGVTARIRGDPIIRPESLTWRYGIHTAWGGRRLWSLFRCFLCLLTMMQSRRH